MKRVKILTVITAGTAFIVLYIFIVHPAFVAKAVWKAAHLELAVRILNKDDAALAFEAGNYFFNGGAYDLDAAERAFEKALALDQNIRLAHYQLGRIAFIKGDLTAALAEINREEELHPEIPNTWYVRGLIYSYLGNFPEAEKNFAIFIEKVPSQWAGYNDLAWAQAKQGKFRETENTILLAFERLPAEKDRNIWLWTSLGVAHLNLGEYNEAKVAFLKSRALSEMMTPEYFWSAYPGNDPRGAEEALKQFKAALSLNLALVYEKTGEYLEAKKEYYNYLSFLPEGPYPKKDEIKERIANLP